MNVLKIVLFFLLFLNFVLAGETGKVAGKVTDTDTKETLPGANIIIVSKWIDGQKTPLQIPMGASTDAEGEYFIINIPPGTYDVSVIYVGYVEQIQSKVQVEVDKTTRLDFAVSSSILATEEIMVVAHKQQEVEVDLTATRQTYNVSEAQNLPGITDVSDIVSLQADVSGGHFRGGRVGEAGYLVNGGSIVNPLDNSVAFEPIAAALDQVEVYTSGFSAEYGNVQSGLTNMITREGNSAKWNSHFEMAMTNAYYKTFGGSIYSEKNLDFYKLVNDPLQWVRDQSKGKFLWQSFDPNLTDNYGPKPIPFPRVDPTLEDSLRIADLVRIFALQSLTNVGLDYDQPDYRLDFSTGGPLNDEMTLFIAGRQNFVQTIFPSAQPDLKRQIMTNFVYRPDPKNKFKASFNYDNQELSIFSTTFYDWLESVFRTNKRNLINSQFALQWSYVLNASTFFETRINFLNTDQDDRVSLLTGDEIAEIYTDQSNWRHYILPSNHEVGKFATSRGFEKTNSFNFSTSGNSQVNKRNLVKAGFQFSYYDINVDYDRSFSSTSSYRFDKYHVFPYEGAIYLQDKMEFEGMIANVGGRYDFYDYNTNIYVNKYSPYRNPNFNPTDPENNLLYDPDKAQTKEAGFKGVFQPRIGFSFPVSSKTVLHLNYGVFSQRPAFEYVFLGRYKTADPGYERLGNPNLKAERTLSYDVGIVRSLPLGFFLDISAYLKDVSNLIQIAGFEDTGGNIYQTFENREYADIKGFHVNLEKKDGFLRGYARYNWQQATGKSASAIGAGEGLVFREPDPNNPNQSSSVTIDPEDIFLNYDRTHKALINLTFSTQENSGLEFMGFKPLDNILISSTYRIQSGRPYTFDPNGKGLRLNKRTPTENDLKLRIQKRFTIDGVETTVYAEGFNLLNDKVFNYGRVFDDTNTNSSTLIGRYEQGTEALLYNTDFFPYNTRIDAWAYSSQPRHYRFGVIFKF